MPLGKAARYAGSMFRVGLTGGNLFAQRFDPRTRIRIAPRLRLQTLVEGHNFADSQFTIGRLVSQVLNLEDVRAGAFGGEDKWNFGLAR